MTVSHEIPPLALDGTCVRCARCGWLDERSTARCAQCGAALPPGRSVPVELAALSVEHRATALRSSTPAQWTAALRGLRETPGSEAMDPAVRETLVRHRARCAVLSERPETAHRHAAAVSATLRARRGPFLIHCVGSPALLAAFGLAAPRDAAGANPALLFVTDLALSLSQKDRRALESAPYVLVSDPDPLREGLASLHALVALIRPEIASTRRSFLARFGRSPSGSHAHVDVALGTLLSEAIVLLDDNPSEGRDDGPLGPIRRWLAAAPRG